MVGCASSCSAAGHGCTVRSRPLLAPQKGREGGRRGWVPWAEHSCAALEAMCVPRRPASQEARWGWGAEDKADELCMGATSACLLSGR